MLKEKGFSFDVAYTSVLKRAIKTLFYVQDELDLHWMPVEKHWRLNERMYGGLQGLNKSETAQKHGEEQVKVSIVVGSILFTYRKKSTKKTRKKKKKGKLCTDCTTNNIGTQQINYSLCFNITVTVIFTTCFV